MTDNEINRAVAEELGWKPHDKSDNHWVRPDGSLVVPNFCNNYNSAAEMREAIQPKERLEFLLHLTNVTGYESPWRTLSATPRQQSEAFIRLRGKWNEVEK